MLAGLVGLVVAAGLLLRGGWDVWAQSALALVLAGGGAAWLCWGLAVGWLPRPRTALSVWVLSLLVLSAASAVWSPVPAYARAAWLPAAAGLLLIPLVTLADPEGRDRIERMLRLAAWALVLAAVYQRLHGAGRPPSTLINQNVFAGAILLLLPLAARAKDWGLIAALLLCLWWTKSVGAWLGLSVALVVHRRAVGAPGFWLGAVAGFVGLVAAYAKLQSPEWLHRVEWWDAAWRMAAHAPWLGLGPGAFEPALPAYAPGRPELWSIYAHQHVLETAAERGWIYAALWLGGLFLILKEAPASRRFGPLAALAHGFVDYALAMPGVFWLFCATTALAMPESGRGVNVPSSRRPILILLVLGVAGGSSALIWRGWTADRLRASAMHELGKETPDLNLVEEKLAASERIAQHPEAARLRGELLLARAGSAPTPAELDAAAAHLERAVALNPFRATSKVMLENVRAHAAAQRTK